MHLLSPRSILLLLGSSLVINALYIPPCSQGELVNDDYAFHESNSVVQVDHRTILARQKGKPLPVRPKPAPAPPKPAPAPPKPAPAPPKTAPGSPKPAPAPGAGQNVVPLPYKKMPRPTNGYDVCDFEGYTCLNDVVPGDVPENSPISAASVAKRSSARSPFTVSLASGKLELASKSYWTSGELFDNKKNGNLNLKEVWLDFAKDSMSDYKVKLFSSKPPQPAPPALSHDYVTEHIVELQSIPRFIEALTETKTDKNKNPIPLKVGKVDSKWFNEWWNKDVQGKVDSRLDKFAGYKNSNDATRKDKTLNNLVFEAMGSTRNVNDFLLCEDGINSYKAKLWANEAPFAETDWKRITKFAATGQLPSNEHLSGVRTVLAVYEYMNTPEVAKRMQQTIKNVKTELKNVKHLTDNKLPKDVKGDDVDLSAAWIDFMNQQLERFRKRGDDWLKDMIKEGLAEYQKALDPLEEAQKAIEKENTEKEPTKKKALQDKRITARNKAVQVIGDKQTKLNAAIKEMNSAKKDLQDAEAIIDGIDDDAKKNAEKIVQKYDAKKTALTKAKGKLTTAKKQMGKAGRDEVKYDEALLKLEIKGLKEDIGHLQAFEKARLGLNMPKAE
ncbi:hypothetical protein EKO04_005206 [Ascochyta lentis]|uniref:Uncharacterized protein n=1 Tax=Ascochyta lentis TaxID=205686 RepID=A0A8H7J4F6_9PLEO|nr:hypothetical protein EKO04_005206 [Ascochyta lentis]